MTDTHVHWDDVYGARQKDKLTWFEASADLSLACITPHLLPNQAVIDIGAGRSNLAAQLLERDFGPITLLDISRKSLELQRIDLGNRVEYVHTDITRWIPKKSYRVWHDRAVFHFLVDPKHQDAYLQKMANTVALDGVAVIATFDEDGPEKCSNLPVQRYSPDQLFARVQAAVPDRFDVLTAHRHIHKTPLGNEQRFQFSILRRIT